MEVLPAQPRGFCAGVVRAVESVELALEMHRVSRSLLVRRRVPADAAEEGVLS